MFTKTIIFFYIFLCLSLGVLSQNFLDSLNTKLKKCKTDSAQIFTYYKAYNNTKASDKTKDSLIKITHQKFSNTCENLCWIFIREGNIYDSKNKKELAVSVYIKALHIADSCNKDLFRARILNRLGKINVDMKNLKKATEYFKMGRYYANRINNPVELSESYSQIGTIHKNKDELDSALLYHMKAYNIRMKLGDKNLLALTYNNLALVNKKKKDYQTTIKYLNMAYDIKMELKDGRGTAFLNNNKANTLKMLKKFSEGLICADMAIDTAFKYHMSEMYLNALVSKAELLETMGTYKEASIVFKKHYTAQDSIRTDIMNSGFQELQEKYESSKKDTEIKEQVASLKLANERDSKKNILIIFSAIALITTIIAIIFIFRSYKQSKKNAVKLIHKNKLIEEKNKEITDSINYAERIQSSFLATKDFLNKTFRQNNYFVLFQPKDIVSGDFYWATTLSNGKSFLVTADSTGHGVPGAIMSILNISSLEKAVIKYSEPDEILNETRKIIIERLKHDGSAEGGKDGMDCSIICLDENKLVYAAANNPVWLVRKDSTNTKTLTELSCDKFPVGKHDRDTTPFTHRFSDLQEGDIIYTITDGFPDQFGGPKGKKFMYKKLKELLISISDLPMEDQKEKLQQELYDWKGSMEQVDDVTIIGIRV